MAALIGVAITLGIVGLLALGAYLWHQVASRPSEREQALAAQIQALKTANYLGAEFFHVQSQMRDEVAQAAAKRQSPPSSPAVGQARVIEADWH